MSIRTEIDRIEAAKEAIATAIAGKDVPVPSGTKLDGMAALIESIQTGGGNSETCTVTVDFPKCIPPKYFTNGRAGFSYVDAQGALCAQEVSGVTSSLGVTSYTFAPVECKCGTILSVATLLGAVSCAKSSDEIIGPVMLTLNASSPLVAFILPETPGNYTITVYYGT